MAHITTEAIALKSIRWGESDRIVTFFSYKLGKVRGIAREARKMKNRFGGALEPFTSVNLTLFDKRSDDLASITAINILEDFSGLREDLERISAASRMVSLVEAITADRDPSHQLFFALREGLRALVESEDHSLTNIIHLECVFFRTMGDVISGLCGNNVISHLCEKIHTVYIIQGALKNPRNGMKHSNSLFRKFFERTLYSLSLIRFDLFKFRVLFYCKSKFEHRNLFKLRDILVT